MVLTVRDPENTEVNIVLGNNTSPNGRVLKFILVILGIKKSKGILGCYITQPKIAKRSVLVNITM